MTYPRPQLVPPGATRGKSTPPRPQLKTKTWAWARRSVFRRDGERCQACGRGLAEVRRLVVDHKVPPERGGAHYDLANLWVLCSGCNFSKGRMTVDEWLAKRGTELAPPKPYLGRPVLGAKAARPTIFGDYSKRPIREP